MRKVSLDHAGIPLPGLRRRLASMVYEGLLMLGVLSVAFMIPQLALGLGFGIVLPGPILFGHLFIVLGAYFLWYWNHGGQTLAMQTWKLQISTPSGTSPSMQFLVLRYLLAWPSILFYGVGLIWALFDREGQFLHDRIVGTCVISKQ